MLKSHSCSIKYSARHQTEYQSKRCTFYDHHPKSMLFLHARHFLFFLFPKSTLYLVRRCIISPSRIALIGRLIKSCPSYIFLIFCISLCISLLIHICLIEIWHMGIILACRFCTCITLILCCAIAPCCICSLCAALFLLPLIIIRIALLIILIHITVGIDCTGSSCTCNGF